MKVKLTHLPGLGEDNRGPTADQLGREKKKNTSRGNLINCYPMQEQYARIYIGSLKLQALPTFTRTSRTVRRAGRKQMSKRFRTTRALNAMSFTTDRERIENVRKGEEKMNKERWKPGTCK